MYLRETTCYVVFGSPCTDKRYISRFCDSPTSDMDARTPKGRGKRGRSAANAGASDLSNFTETRSSVHSKLRSQNTAGGKGRRGPGAGSPTPFATPKVSFTFICIYSNIQTHNIEFYQLCKLKHYSYQILFKLA